MRMDGNLTEKVKEQNNQVSEEIQKLTESELQSLKNELTNDFEGFKNEIKSVIQETENDLKNRTSGLSKWVAWDTLRWTVAVLLGGLAIGLTPWMVAWFNSPTWYSGVTHFQENGADHLAIKRDRIATQEGNRLVTMENDHLIVKLRKEDQ